MALPDRTPKFNLNVVVHETGLKPDTLRVWEKRYGLPQPKRTAGGHRLYSHYDMEMLKWFVARKAEGLAIKRAVDLWHQIETEGQNPLQVGLNTGASHSLNVEAGSEVLAGMRQAWVSACKNFDEPTAESKLSEAFALFSPEVVCAEVLQKGLAELGQGWYQGQISIQQEHFATSLTVRRLQALIASSPPPNREGLILIGCPPEEDHSFGTLVLTLFLRRRGWPVTYLGANVPLMTMEETLAAVKPNLVVMAAQHLHTAATLSQMAFSLQENSVPLGFGGGVFSRIDTLSSRIPGHFLGNDLPTAVQTIEQVLTTPLPIQTVDPISKAYEQASTHFRAQQTSIESHLWQNIASFNMTSSQLTMANRELAKAIIAALTLGDINLAEEGMHWIEDLVQNHNLSADSINQYLAMYSKVGQIYLDKLGAPIVTWLTHWIR